MSQPNRRTWFRQISLWGLFDAGFAASLLITFVSFLGSYSWLFETLSHFRVQYVILLCFSAIVYGIRKQFVPLALALGAGILCSPVIWDAYFQKSALDASGPTFKAIIMHVNLPDGKFDSALSLIRSEEPIFVVMEDVGPEWEKIIKREISALPDARFVSRHGTAVLSMRPWDKVEDSGISSFSFPGLKISYSDPDLVMFAVHFPAPISASLRQERLSQFRKLIVAVNEAKGPNASSSRAPNRPVLLLGDLNCSPWSPLFKQLLADTDLQNARNGFGINPTWPSNIPVLLIPIDHALTTQHDFQVDDVRVGPNIGSDHYPLIIKLKWSSKHRQLENWR